MAFRAYGSQIPSKNGTSYIRSRQAHQDSLSAVTKFRPTVTSCTWWKRGFRNSNNRELHEAGNACWVLHSNRLTDSNDSRIFLRKPHESKTNQGWISRLHGGGTMYVPKGG